MMVEIIYGIIAAIIYALLGFIKSEGESFDPFKFTKTIIIGAIIGVIMSITGIPITEQSVAEQITAYGGLIIVVDYILKIIWRKVLNK